MADLHDRFAADTDVLFTQLGEDEGVLLHLHTQYYFSLNETGLLIWQGFVEGQTVEEVAAKLRAHYDVDEADALHHVQAFADHLHEKKLMVPIADGATG